MQSEKRKLNEDSSQPSKKQKLSDLHAAISEITNLKTTIKHILKENKHHFIDLKRRGVATT